MLSVGIPKEIKRNETRVGITPEAAARLSAAGIRILIERGAGILSGYSDEEFEAAGAGLSKTAAEVYGETDIILKVKEPQPAEFDLLRPGQILFCFLHLASPENKDLVQCLLNRKVTAVGFEAVEDRGMLPLLIPMSQIAGALAAFYGLLFSETKMVFGEEIVYPGAFSQQMQQAASSYPDPAKKIAGKRVLIFGGGIAGVSAASAVKASCSHASLVERNPERRSHLKASGLEILASDDLTDEKLSLFDIFIGAAHARGQRAAQVLSPEQMEVTAGRGSRIFVDIAIDQGGNFPEAHSTSYEDPLYLDKWGHIRFAVPNLPAMAGRAASAALSAQTERFVKTLAGEGAKVCFGSHPLAKGLNTHDGKIQLEEVRKAHPEVNL